MIRFFVFLLAFVSSSVFAQALPYTPATTSTGYTFGSAVATSANQASFTFAPAANGSVYATSTGKISLGQGATAAITAAGSVPPSSYTPLLKKAFQALPLIGTGLVLVDLATELKYQVTKDATTGAVTIVYKETECLADCYKWGSPVSYYATYDSAEAACAAWIEYQNAPNATYCAPGSAGGTAPAGLYQYFSYKTSSTTPHTNVAVSGSGGIYIYKNKSVAPYTTERPSNINELADSIAAKSGWPTSSNIGQAIDYAITNLPATEVLPINAPSTITGPVTVDMPPVTVTMPDGSVKTETPQKVITYAPPEVKITDKTTSSILGPSGEVTDLTIREQATNTSGDPANAPDPCVENPDRIGCSKFGTPDDTVSLPQQDSGFAGIIPEVFASSSGCPQPLSFNVMGHSYAIEYTPICNGITSYVAPLVLILGVALAAFVFVGGFRS